MGDHSLIRYMHATSPNLSDNIGKCACVRVATGPECITFRDLGVAAGPKCITFQDLGVAAGPKCNIFWDLGVAAGERQKKHLTVCPKTYPKFEIASRNRVS